MYREMLTVARSIYKISRILPMVHIALQLGKLHGYFAGKFIELSGYAGKELRVRMYDDIMFGLVLHYIMCKSYLEIRADGQIDIKAIRYEDLVSDPLAACRAIMHHCNLPESLAEKAVRGMEKDSQENSLISRKVLAPFDRQLTLSPKTKNYMNDLLKKAGLPLIGEDSLLPGTITYVKK